MRVVLLLLALAAVGPVRARADTTVDAPPTGSAPAAHFRLDFTLKPDRDVATVRAIALVDGTGKDLWRRPPPSEISKLSVDGKRGRAYLRDPNAPLESLGLFPGVTLIDDDFAMMVASEQLLVFARGDGRLLFHETVGVQGFGALPFQHADVELRCGARTASRRVGMDYFLLDCGSRVVFYFVQGFAVFSTAPWRRVTGKLFPDVSPRASPWVFPFDGGSLTLRRVN